jgi:hypothetical protein
MNKRAAMLALAAGLCVVVLAGLVAAVAAPARAQVTTRCVATTGEDDGDCTQAVSPCRTVQYAVDAASEGEVVRVAAGVYDEVGRIGWLAQVVYMSKAVTIRGGYAAPAFAATGRSRGPPDDAGCPGPGAGVVHHGGDQSQPISLERRTLSVNEDLLMASELWYTWLTGSPAGSPKMSPFGSTGSYSCSELAGRC